MSSRLLKYILRSLAQLILLLVFYLHVQELVSLPFWVGAFILGTLAGLFLGHPSRNGGLKFIPAFLIFCCFLFLVRIIVWIVSLQGGGSSEILLFDNSFVPLLIPLIITWCFSFLSRRLETTFSFEAIINGWLFFVLTWSQGHYNTSLFPHPSLLALLTAVFIFLEALILLISSGARGWRRMIVFLVLIIVVLGGGSALFLNRYTEGAVSQGGGLVKPTLFRFDFSRFVKLESEISMSNELVLLFGSETPADRMLLRRYVLSGYGDERGFYLNPDWEALPLIPDKRTIYEDPGYLSREQLWQDYYLVNFDPSSLVALNYPVEVVPMKNWGDSSFLRTYRALSMVAPYIGWELEEAGEPELPSNSAEYYTEYGEDEAIFALAIDVAGPAETQYDKVMAIQMYLMSNYFYSLKPGVAVGEDQLHHFLFTSKKGYCSYFAFAMALMCRSLDIPARVAVGFFVDPSQGVMNLYPIRADMAHAWVEVYFEDFGWISFDPTSQVLAPGEEFQMGGVEMEEFLSLIEEILANRDGALEDTAVVLEEDQGLSVREILLIGVDHAVRYWWLLLLLLWSSLSVLFWLIPHFRFRISRDELTRSIAVFSLLEKSCRVRGLGVLRDESLIEWAHRIKFRDDQFSPMVAVELRLKFLYSSQADPGDLDLLVAEVKTQRSLLSGETSFLRRIAILLFPWGIR